jgi:protoheme IX farnesyltransferase
MRAQLVRAAPAQASTALRSWRETVGDYVSLTKPRIIILLLITTIPAMILAADGLPSPWLMGVTLAGGALAAGGANAINCYVDRDLDRLMHRTQGRPLPSGRMEPEGAMAFGIALGLVAFVGLATLVNLLSAVLAAAAMLFYVFVYTLWLKRSTPQNIVIGGAAGAMPPLIGWAAVTNAVELPAVVLFAIILFWTPPHFWALALRFSTDYERAGVPMLPVTRGQKETKAQILLYSIVLVAVSLLLFATGAAGYLYLGSALVLGAVFVLLALRLLADATGRTSTALFRYSVLYLALLFGAMAVDGLMPL